MAAAKKPTRTQVAKYLSSLLENEMTLGNRAAITRTIQLVKGDRTWRG